MSEPLSPPLTVIGTLRNCDGQLVADALNRTIPGLRWVWRAYSEVSAYNQEDALIARLSMWFGAWAVVVGREELPLDLRDRASLETLTLAVRQALEAHHNQLTVRAATLRAALDATTAPIHA